MSRPDFDPDALQDVTIHVEQLAPTFFHAFLDRRDRRPASVLLGHLPRLLERGLLHVDGGIGEARGPQRPAYVVRVEVREDDVRYGLGSVARFVQIVEKVLVSPEFVATDQYFGQLGPESRVDEQKVISGL